MLIFGIVGYKSAILKEISNNARDFAGYGLDDWLTWNGNLLKCENHPDNEFVVEYDKDGYSFRDICTCDGFKDSVIAHLEKKDAILTTPDEKIMVLRYVLKFREKNNSHSYVHSELLRVDWGKKMFKASEYADFGAVLNHELDKEVS